METKIRVDDKKEAKLWGALNGECKEAILVFLDRVANAAPPDWIGQALAKMNQNNIKFAKDRSARTFSELDIRQLLNVLVSSVHEIAQYGDVSLSLRSRASLVWDIAKQLAHSQESLSESEFVRAVRDVVNLMEDIGASEECCEMVGKLENEKVVNIGELFEKRRKMSSDLFGKRESAWNTYRHEQESSCHELWHETEPGLPLEGLLGALPAIHGRVCLTYRDVPRILDGHFVLQILVDAHAVDNSVRISVEDIEHCSMSSFWLDVIRSSWEGMEGRRRWSFFEVPTSSSYEIETNGRKFSVSKLRLWLERDGYLFDGFGCYMREARNSMLEDDRYFEDWIAGKPTGKKYEDSILSLSDDCMPDELKYPG